jgi:hypothetical protein
VRIRPNQEMPNQILDNKTSSKYCDKVENQIEHKNILADDGNWLGNSFLYYNKVIHKKNEFPTL